MTTAIFRTSVCDLNATFGRGRPVRAFVHEKGLTAVPVVQEEEKEQHTQEPGEHSVATEEAKERENKEQQETTAQAIGSPGHSAKKEAPVVEMSQEDGASTSEGFTHDGLLALYKADLIRFCSERGLPHKRANKSVLIQRLLDDQKAGKEENKTGQPQEEEEDSL